MLSVPKSAPAHRIIFVNYETAASHRLATAPGVFRHRAEHHMRGTFLLRRQLPGISTKTNDKLQASSERITIEQTTMKLNFKTLDRKTFSLSIDENCEKVEELISLVEDYLGDECLYKLIYAGKLLKEECYLKDYSFTSVVPIIIMATKLPNQKENEKVELPAVASDTDYFQFKRVRTVTEDSGIEEDINCNHFVLDTEIDAVIDIIGKCDYLQNETETEVNKPDGVMKIYLKYCEQNDKDDDLKEIIEYNMDKILKANMNRSQMMAMFEDIQDIHDEYREPVVEKKFELNKFSADCLDDTEHNETNETKNGIENPFLEVAADTTSSKEADMQPICTAYTTNPLSFLRESEEFQFLRYRVLQEPNLLQPLLLSFGRSHPNVMRVINSNKETFISMLHEQTGAKLWGRH